MFNNVEQVNKVYSTESQKKNGRKRNILSFENKNQHKNKVTDFMHLLIMNVANSKIVLDVDDDVRTFLLNLLATMKIKHFSAQCTGICLMFFKFTFPYVFLLA